MKICVFSTLKIELFYLFKKQFLMFCSLISKTFTLNNSSYKHTSTFRSKPDR